MKNLKKLVLSIMIMSLLSACANWSKTAKGGAIGATAGGALGAVIGKKAGNTALGAVIGAAVGGTAGALIGKRMDKQAKEMQDDLKNAKIERVGEGIIVTFDSGILFDYDKANLQPAATQNLNELAATLKKYDDTDLLVVGHTDSKGTDAYNEALSERRAAAVTNYMETIGIYGTRIKTEGKGEVEPIAENDTDQGRSQNRRVEVAIYANKKMQRAAKRGDLEVN